MHLEMIHGNLGSNELSTPVVLNIFRENKVNTVAADVLAPFITRASEPIEWTV